jgi:hypothetical protein
MESRLPQAWSRSTPLPITARSWSDSVADVSFVQFERDGAMRPRVGIPSGMAEGRIRSRQVVIGKGVQIMCLTCGCMDAHLEMGEANITYEDVKRAADENSRSVAETLDIMERTKAKDRQAHPQEYGARAESRS